LSILSISVAATLLACPSAKTPDSSSHGAPSACGRLDDEDCATVRGMLSAMDAFSTVEESLVLDARNTLVPGRGMERAGASWKPTLTECARARDANAQSEHREAKVDPSAIDFSYIGVAVDEAIVDGNVPASQVVQAGGDARHYTVRLLAVAFARELAPQSFVPSDAVTHRESACACDRATHFVGAVKYGGMLSYETTLESVELQGGTVLDVVKAKLLAGNADVREVTVGGLSVSGLEDGHAPRRPLDFKVKNPVPIAYAVVPVSDVCK
jgi:hypothetical protein